MHSLSHYPIVYWKTNYHRSHAAPFGASCHKELKYYRMKNALKI